MPQDERECKTRAGADRRVGPQGVWASPPTGIKRSGRGAHAPWFFGITPPSNFFQKSATSFSTIRVDLPRLLCPRALVSLILYCATLRLPALGYTVDSFAPAQLIRRFPNLLLLRSCLWQSISTFPRSRFALRANLRLVYLAPALALDCLSLWTCAIARVLAPARQTPLRA